MGNQNSNICHLTSPSTTACYASEIEPSSTLDEFFEQIPPLEDMAGAGFKYRNKVKVAGYKGCHGKMQHDTEADCGSPRPQLPPDFMLDVKLLSPNTRKQRLEATS